MGFTNRLLPFYGQLYSFVVASLLTRFSTKILVIRLANGGWAGGRILNGVKLWRQTVVSAQKL